jgi:hypothetical protein
MASPEAGHHAAKPIEELFEDCPDLRGVVKGLQPHYVFVGRYLRTIPRERDGATFRSDAYVNGLYVVDVTAVRWNRPPLIDQDYLVQWRDNRTLECSYYSGIPRRYRRGRPELWVDIAEFCSEFGHKGQYGCPDVGHSYANELDPDLPQEAPWPEQFRRAMATARELASPATVSPLGTLTV